LNYSLGAVLHWNLHITIVPTIDIDDPSCFRKISAGDVRAYLQSLGFIGIGGGHFFIAASTPRLKESTSSWLSLEQRCR
jgi:hypothetical protein